jgi:hypothetical protein
MKKMILAFAVLAASAGSAHALSAGDWVLARFQNGNYWFPGVVQTAKGDNIVVLYDDGDKETLGRKSVRAYDWKIGSRVECNYKGAGDWYAGKITGLGGEKLSIAYDDGDKETTKTGLCRSN